MRGCDSGGQKRWRPLFPPPLTRCDGLGADLVLLDERGGVREDAAEEGREGRAARVAEGRSEAPRDGPRSRRLEVDERRARLARDALHGAERVGAARRRVARARRGDGLRDGTLEQSQDAADERRVAGAVRRQRQERLARLARRPAAQKGEAGLQRRAKDPRQACHSRCIERPLAEVLARRDGCGHARRHAAHARRGGQAAAAAL